MADAQIRISFGISPDGKSVDLNFIDDAKRSMQTIGFDEAGLADFVTRLLAMRAKLLSSSGGKVSVTGSGMAKLPRGIQFNRMIAGTAQPSGLPLIGFEIVPDLWASFELKQGDVQPLKLALEKYVAQVQKAPTEN